MFYFIPCRLSVSILIHSRCIVGNMLRLHLMNVTVAGCCCCLTLDQLLWPGCSELGRLVLSYFSSLFICRFFISGTARSAARLSRYSSGLNKARWWLFSVFSLSTSLISSPRLFSSVVCFLLTQRIPASVSCLYYILFSCSVFTLGTTDAGLNGW